MPMISLNGTNPTKAAQLSPLSITGSMGSRIVSLFSSIKSFVKSVAGAVKSAFSTDMLTKTFFASAAEGKSTSSDFNNAESNRDIEQDPNYASGLFDGRLGVADPCNGNTGSTIPPISPGLKAFEESMRNDLMDNKGEVVKNGYGESNRDIEQDSEDIFDLLDRELRFMDLDNVSAGSTPPPMSPELKAFEESMGRDLMDNKGEVVKDRPSWIDLCVESTEENIVHGVI